MLLITTPINNPSKHYKHFRKAVACIGLKLELCRHCCFRVWSFEDFRPGFRFWHICHVDRHGHFTLKQLRLSLVNETHTKPYTRPRLTALRCIYPSFSRCTLASSLFIWSKVSLNWIKCVSTSFSFVSIPLAHSRTFSSLSLLINFNSSISSFSTYSAATLLLIDRSFLRSEALLHSVTASLVFSKIMFSALNFPSNSDIFASISLITSLN